MATCRPSIARSRYSPTTDRQTERAAEAGNHQRLGHEQLSHDAPAPGADRQPRGDLDASRLGPREQERRDIETGQQDHSPEHHQHQLKPALVARAKAAQAPRAPATIRRVGERTRHLVARTDALPGNHLQFFRRPFDRDVRAHPAHDLDPGPEGVSQMPVAPNARARSGMMTSDDKPTFTPANPLGSTPTMVK